jgi:hypothetical protein
MMMRIYFLLLTRLFGYLSSTFSPDRDVLPHEPPDKMSAENENKPLEEVKAPEVQGEATQEVRAVGVGPGSTRLGDHSFEDAL